LNLEGGTVTFRYKTNAHESQIPIDDTLLEGVSSPVLLHILPPRFVKIRSYGLLSNETASTRIAQARQLLAQSPTLLEQQSPEEVLAIKQIEPPPLVCPYCGRPTLVLVRVVERPKRPPILDTS